MWYLWLIVGVGAVVMFIKCYDGNRRNTSLNNNWIHDLIDGLSSDSSSDGGSDFGIGD